jgi:hypothetical protein
MTDTERQIADRRRQWATLSPAQRMSRIQAALRDVLELSRWRKLEARQRTAARLKQQHKVKDYDRV